MNFRYDLNGLRAIAVIAVVLFHFNPAWVPGGFAGVDVFFVISGFLMTGIIFRGLENDNFNLFKFYVARANRIIPALAVLCLVLLVFGWFYITPLDYRALGKHVASSMGFLSNVIYWRESGYFDAASHEKWLLHTWSLSVEWQFYILYPIVLVALKKFLSLENLKRLIVIGTVLGFCLSVIVTMKWPNPAYYLLPTRAWEMMMGGVAFLYPWSLSESRKKAVELTGLALILGSYAFVSSDIPWPGHFALLPVLGAYLMIVSNQQSSFITNNAFFQCLGKWSYSIYLWHWPVVLFGYSLGIADWWLYGLPLSLILGSLSSIYIERIKFKSVDSITKIFFVKHIYLALMVGIASSYIYIHNGIMNRYEHGGEYTKFLNEHVYPSRDNGYCMFNLKDNDVSLEDGTNCYSGSVSTSPSQTTVLFGDSYAGHYDPFWDELFKEINKSYLSISTHVCNPSLNKRFDREGISDVSIRSKAFEQCMLNRNYLKVLMDSGGG
jgi:peptidoglycan/LPS O-acetylase OafA/YrhL